VQSGDKRYLLEEPSTGDACRLWAYPLCGRSERLDHNGLLVVIAEVAAAFVGFSMVVGLLRPSSAGAALRFYSIRDVAEISLIVVAGALLPLASQLFPVSEAATWRICSALLSIAWLVTFSFAVARFSRVGSLIIRDRNPIWGAVAVSLVSCGNVLLWWNVVSPSGPAGGRYVAALLILLAIAGILFMSATFSGDPEDPAA
jgi:hypothetical protein